MNAAQQDSIHSSESKLPSHRVWNGQSYSKQHVVQTSYGPCYFSMEQSVHSGCYHYASYVSVSVDEATNTTGRWTAEKSSN